MKTSLPFVLFAALAGALPIRATAPVDVAIFVFQSDPKLEPTYGAALANLVQADLRLLDPLRMAASRPEAAGLSFDDAPTATAASDLGRQLHAQALVTGRVLQNGSQLILAAKVIDAATGAALATSLTGHANTQITELAAELSIRIGGVILRESRADAHARWPSAMIRGWRSSIPPDNGLTLGGATYRVMLTAIDGAVIGAPSLHLEDRHDLVPGRHRFAAIYAEGSQGAAFDFYLDLRPGQIYGLRGGQQHDHAQIWVIQGNSDQRVPLIASTRGGLATATGLDRQVSKPVEHEIIDTRLLRD